MAILKNTLELVRQILTNNLLQVDHDVNLRALVCKNQTNSKFRGKGEKFDLFLILMLDRLDYN